VAVGEAGILLYLVTMYSTPLTTALDLLDTICQQRMEAHFAQQPWQLEEVVADERWPVAAAALQLPEYFAPAEILVLLVALAPHVRPGFFENIITRLFPQGGEFIEWGGAKGQQHRGMLPTAETALFILAGTHVEQRLQAQAMFSETGRLATHGLLQVEPVKEGEPAMSGRLLPDSDWLEKILMGREASPVFSAQFPARRVQTKMEWTDLVLHPQTLEQVHDIRLWMKHQHQVLHDEVLARKIKPGFRVLFYGPAGTGKTLTATLIGKEFNLPVYRIDLSQVVSKYIGETEKHLEWVFGRAVRKNWILFFDEADALFGKRTNVQSAHDKYANQEVAYLLQRIEEYEGLLILASNFKGNIDEAFLRRFHSIIHFPMPNANERQKLWQQNWPATLPPAADIDASQLAAQYEITGAGIVNVVHYAALRAFSRGDRHLQQSDVMEGIRKEFRKEEKGM
jgi:ATPase family associated with various cellular activities (AAA)